MQTPSKQRRLLQESELVERAWRVLQDSKELIQERQAHLATLERLIMRRNNIAHEASSGNTP